MEESELIEPVTVDVLEAMEMGPFREMVGGGEWGVYPAKILSVVSSIFPMSSL